MLWIHVKARLQPDRLREQQSNSCLLCNNNNDMHVPRGILYHYAVITASLSTQQCYSPLKPVMMLIIICYLYAVFFPDIILLLSHLKAFELSVKAVLNYANERVSHQYLLV